MKRTRYCAILMILYISISILLGNIPYAERNVQKTNKAANQLTSPEISEYWHNFTHIHVKNNWSAFGSWLKGDGSWGNPYRIENMTINATNSPIKHGIFIEDSTDVYFTIKNCTIYGATGSSASGIYLKNSNNGTLIRNNCSGNYYGVYFDNVNNVSFSENIVNECNHGLFLFEAQYVFIENNDFINNIQTGVILFGYSIFNVKDVNMTENDLSGSGISFSGDINELLSYNISTTNTMNGKPIYYYVNETGLTQSNFTNAASIMLFYCNNSDISGLNITNVDIGISLLYCHSNVISNNNLSLMKDQGIDVISSNNNTITGNRINDTENGIRLNNCFNTSIIQNVINNSQRGIYLYHSPNTTVKSNQMNGCGLVIQRNSDLNVMRQKNITDNLVNSKSLQYYQDKDFLTESNFTDAGQIILLNCNYSRIAEQRLSNCSQGVALYYCNNLSLQKINTSHNLYDGIYLDHCNYVNISYSHVFQNERGIHFLGGIKNNISEIIGYNNSISGIFIEGTDNSTIANCKLYNNTQYGLETWGASYNNITLNWFESNLEYGIRFSDGGSLYNLLFNNSFYNKILAHVYDIADNNNKWNTSQRGNYWDDYEGSDGDDDGIGDSSYLIAVTGVFDLKPIWWDTLEIGINAPLNNTVFNNTAPLITVDVDKGVADTVWYTIGLDPQVYIFGDDLVQQTKRLDSNGWRALQNGTILVHFYANDSRNGQSSAELRLGIDILAPNITIQTPVNQTEYGADAPEYSLLMTGGYSNIWYCILNGSVWTDNYSVSGVSGSLHETIWDTLGDGNYIVRFYANDSVGNIGFNNSIVIKDTSGSTGDEKEGGDEEGDEDSDGNDDNPPETILTFLTSPTGIIILSLGGAALVGIVLILKKRKGYIPSDKDKQKIEQLSHN